MSIDLNLYLWRPALPRPPCLPAPRPALMPRPWVLSPRNLRVRLGIATPLDHPADELVDRASAVAERSAEGERFLGRPPASLRGPEAEQRLESLNVREALLGDGASESGKVLARGNVLDGLGGQPRAGGCLAPFLEEERNGLGFGLAPGDVPLDRREHATHGRDFGHDRRVVRSRQVKETQGLDHVVPSVDRTPDANDHPRHGSLVPPRGRAGPRGAGSTASGRPPSRTSALRSAPATAPAASHRAGRVL